MYQTGSYGDRLQASSSPDPAACPSDRAAAQLLDSTLQHAKLVPLRVGQHHPGLLALPDIDPAGTQLDDPLDFLGLITANRIQVDVEPILDRLGLRHSQEEQRWPGTRRAGEL